MKTGVDGSKSPGQQSLNEEAPGPMPPPVGSINVETTVAEGSCFLVPLVQNGTRGWCRDILWKKFWTKMDGHWLVP